MLIRRIKIKSIISIAFIAFLIFLFFNFHQLSHQQEESSLILYVSPDGNDRNAGSLEAPLATFPGARDRVRLIKETAKNIFVYFREGEYVFDKTIAKFIGNYRFNYPGELPGRKKLSDELRKVIRSFSN